MSKKIIFSGIQPSGQLHIGAYLGSLKNWVELQNNYDNQFCIVDLHAITVPQDSKELNKNTIKLARLYLACGIDPKKSLLFVQSHVPEHTELAWLLNCFTYMGELEKMTQYKDKSSKYKQRASVGLFTYPILMAADILLYQTNLVPVGSDQIQHVELTRDIAKRVNNKYNHKIFTIPETYIPKQGARIKGLLDPTKKMSKSADNPNDAINLLDDEKTIAKKVMKAVTDADGKIKYNINKKPGISNLLTILSIITNTSIKDLEKKHKNTQYGDFKKEIAFKLADYLKPIQEKYNNTSEKEVKDILNKHSKIASKKAQKTLRIFKEKIGFLA